MRQDKPVNVVAMSAAIIIAGLDMNTFSVTCIEPLCGQRLDKRRHVLKSWTMLPRGYCPIAYWEK
jgi:hypothetical protein